MGNPAHWRHQGQGLNMAFHDGHARFIPAQDYIDYESVVNAPLFMRATFDPIYSTWNNNWVDGKGIEAWWRF